MKTLALAFLLMAAVPATAREKMFANNCEIAAFDNQMERSTANALKVAKFVHLDENGRITFDQSKLEEINKYYQEQNVEERWAWEQTASTLSIKLILTFAKEQREVESYIYTITSENGIIRSIYASQDESWQIDENTRRSFQQVTFTNAKDGRCLPTQYELNLVPYDDDGYHTTHVIADSRLCRQILDLFQANPEYQWETPKVSEPLAKAIASYPNLRVNGELGNLYDFELDHRYASYRGDVQRAYSTLLDCSTLLQSTVRDTTLFAQ